MNAAKKKVVGIALITAVALLGDSMLIIVLPIYWQEFGLTAIWQIGLLLSINRFVRLPINPLVGMFYQHFQLRTGVFIALAIAIFTTACYGFLKEFWLLLLVRVLWGIAWSLLRLGGFLTVIDVSIDSNRGNYVGLYNGLWGLGGLVGMLAGGILVDQTSLSFVTTSFAILGLLSLPAIIYFVPVSKSEQQERKRKEGKKKNWLNSYIVLILLTGALMGFIVFGLFATTLSSLIEEMYHNEWKLAHFTIGAATLAGIIQAFRWGWDPFIAPKIGKIIDRVKTPITILLIPLFVGGILFYTLVNVQTMIALVIALLLFQFISTIFVTTTDTLATNAAAQTNKVKVMTAHTIVVDIGAAMGPLLAFMIIDMHSITSIYYLSGALLVSLGFIWLLFIGRRMYH
ncbi:MFS transporter [Gracilibacillus sp. S3-1-1]|uniref:MFS transporter n=1 Tax=Gracilibacillus pellucidus TaxID=3095368 RepID=A0ACC6M0E2_9BACI|nr:MFS transporter [Gracilibacillus sp. S3-1-1]MDX8044403.1 MFS transporter [Gracilibacillus sp. S3-1-1]